MNMKHGLYLLMFLLCGTGLQAQDRVVEQPAFDACKGGKTKHVKTV